MAEHIRRVGGDVESFRGITNRRDLLPQEIQLCKLIGVSKKEYWFFLDEIESKNGKRSEAYDLVPDIQNGFAAGWAVQLVVGLALTAVSMLLAPKPKQQKYKTPPSLKTADASGSKRYSPQTGFDSVQELAELGDIIPLVFTKRFFRWGEDAFGGVRVNSKLLWSQLKSLGKSQQLKAIFLLSSGKLGATPAFQGYAIGDTLLENYTTSKLSLYFLPGETSDNEVSRFSESNNKYSEGTLATEHDKDIALPSVFSDYANEYVDTIFSGTRSPNTQVEFGLYDPLPNSMKFMLPYELVLKGKDASNTDDIEKKREKVQTRFPRFAGVHTLNNSTLSGRRLVTIGDNIWYALGDMNPEDHYKDFGQWGVEDVKSSVNATREGADDSISKGEQFMIGTSLAICNNIVTSGTDTNSHWEMGIYKDFSFKVTEPGEIDVRKYHRPEDVHNSFELLIPQKCSIATISNNKSCDITEIGIKSTVWKQITGFPNVNSHPGNWEYEHGSGVVHDYEQSNGSIQLGSINKYIKRLSFFKLFIRSSGHNAEWKPLGDIPFCVTGRTPQPQYNFIRINHPYGQYEFRLVPYPGNEAKLKYENREVYRLGGTDAIASISYGEFDIRFAGSANFKLTPNQLSNEEWYLGELPSDAAGSVLSFIGDKFIEGNIPTVNDWVAQGDPNITDGSAGAQREDWYGNDAKKGSRATYSGGRRSGKWWIMWYNNWIGAIDKDASPKCFESGGSKYCLSTSVAEPNSTTRKAVTKYNWEPVEVVPTVYNDQKVSPDKGDDTLRVNVSKFTKDGVTGYKWSISFGGRNYESGDKVTIPYANVQVQVLTDSANLITLPWPAGQNLNPYDAVADYITYDAERSSHLDGPEHSVVYINEQIKMNSADMPYTDIALAGIRMNSSKEWSSFSQLSAYIQRGVEVETLIESGYNSTNLFPEIAYALLTDRKIGAGDLVGEVSVDKELMTKAAHFCKSNDFYWDGVVTQSENLRDFIYQQATYCLLDFTIIGGRFALVPAVPHYIDSDGNPGEINLSKPPEIKALFTDGNTRNLKVSFLSPEERQLFQAKILWRKEKLNGFPETKVFEIRLSDAQLGSEKHPREVFDMSVFCTSQSHAEKFGKYALRVRQKVDHGIKFETTPQAAMNLIPGEHFRFYSEATHTSRFANGVITDTGVIQSQSIITNGTSIYYWKPGDEEVKGPTAIVIKNDLADSAFHGCVFTEAKTDISDRVYKLESLTYSEEGFVEIAGSYEPLTSTGGLAVLDWANEDDFVVQGN